MITFGDGKHAINIIREGGDAAPKNILYIEEGGARSYEEGAAQGRRPLPPVGLDEIEEGGGTLWKFKSAASVRVVIEALAEIAADLDGTGA